MANKESVLITGIAGFIGSNLATRLLKEGYRVVGFDNLQYGLQERVPKEVEFHKYDIRSADFYPLFKDVDYVFHLAAKSSISDCQDDPVETADINVVGSTRVFEAARRAPNVKKVVYAESSTVYQGVTKFPTDESVVAPKSFYARSKVAVNLFATGYHLFHGVKTVGLRYFSTYGPNQDYRRTVPPLPSGFILKLMRGEAPVIYGTGEKRRDFMHVDDLNDFHLLCLKDDRVDNRVFNLGTGTNISIIEVYDIVSRLLGSNIKPVFKENKSEEEEVGLADIGAAKSVGWNPKISFETGVQSVIDYLKQEVAKGNISLS